MLRKPPRCEIRANCPSSRRVGMKTWEMSREPSRLQHRRRIQVLDGDGNTDVVPLGLEDDGSHILQARFSSCCWL